MVTIYRLRPHHILSFANYLNSELLHSVLIGDYSEDFNRKLIEYFKKLSGSDCHIEIVPAIDDICSLDCNRRRPECEEPEDPLDTPGLYFIGTPIYGIGSKIGMRYTISEILRRLRI